MYHYLSRLFALLLTLTLVACSNSSANSSLSGRILVWHDWTGSEAEVLNQLLDQFSEIYPDVRIIRSAIPPDQELYDEFISHTTAGLGPDLLIGKASFVPDFVEQGLIEELSQAQLDSSIYLPAALDQLRDESHLYGLPFSLSTDVLYYNAQLISSPPKTLQELLDEANNGHRVALSDTFEGALWGIQAFGGRVFDEQGRLALGEGGFSNWLGWLKDAKSLPNIILNNNQETVQSLFTKGQVAYYVGNSRELPKLTEALGKEAVGVALLPSGPSNKAGPLMKTEALMFSRASNQKERQLALELAKFLTNVEQQTTLAMAEVGRMPAHSRVTIDERVAPKAATLVKQTKTAVTVALPERLPMRDLILAANEIYVQVLAGVLERNQAINKLTNELKITGGLETVASITEPSCLEGRLRVQHHWPEAEVAALEEIRRSFMRLCPSVIIDFTQGEMRPDDRYYQYQDEVAQGKGPDLIIDSTETFELMVTTGSLRDITSMVSPQFLQQYMPSAQESLRYKGKLYGLPLSMEVMALYYNRDLVSKPPSALDDLLNRSDSSQQVALPLDFAHTFWGIPAFGGRLLDQQNQVILNQGGFAEWLTWLQQARQEPGMILTDDEAALKQLFMEKKAAYLGGEKKWLQEFQAALGQEKVGVVPLPAGPKGPSGPLLTVEGLMLNPTSNEQQAALALEFAKYMTSIDSQMLLLEQTNRVPVNINVDASNYPAIAGFLEQAHTATVPLHKAEMMTVWDQANSLEYEEILNSSRDLVEIVDDFTQRVNDYNRYVLHAEKPPLRCEGNGQVLLWHSWQGQKANALLQLMDDFNNSCPEIHLKAQFIPVTELTAQLLITDTNRTPPDFLLASNDLLKTLKENGLIKKMTPWVEENKLNYYPWFLEPFSDDSGLYGLPQTAEMMALYYNKKMIENPARTIDDLIAATAKGEVALDSSFYGAFWGISAFGGSFFNESGQIATDQSGLIGWLNWLQAAQQKAGVVLSANQADLQEHFKEGQAAYLVAGAEALPSLFASVGEQYVGVVPLPTGEAGPAVPFLKVEGYIFHAQGSNEQTLLALQFAEFATSIYGQTQLLEKAQVVPTNWDVNLPYRSPIEQFTLSADMAQPLPPNWSIIFREGDIIYQNVLQHQQPPVEAVADLLKVLKQQLENE